MHWCFKYVADTERGKLYGQHLKDDTERSRKG